jgi:hypothetical protein
MTANSVEAEKWFYVVDSHAKRPFRSRKLLPRTISHSCAFQR